MTITEPMTLATDYLVGACAAGWSVRLARRGRAAGQRAVQLWAGAFAALALASFSGGTVHGFALHLGESGYDALWQATVLVAGVASFAILAAATVAGFTGAWRTVLLAAAGAKLALYSGWMLFHDDFLWVILDYGTAMLFALAVHLRLWRRRGDPASPWIAAGILVSFAAAAVQASGLSLHRHFNHNDLYHVIQLVGLYLLYRGAGLVRDRGAPGAVAAIDGARDR